MATPQPDSYALLESAFHASPKLRHHKQLPRRSDEHRTFARAAAPLKRDASYTNSEAESVASSQQPTPLASPGALNGTENGHGLPPTPPTISQDGHTTQDAESSPHADGLVNSLMSKKSSLSTPVNARSPPTPDPSPPRTTESNASKTANERPPLFAYPSSRAESFTTAREDPMSSEPSDSRSMTPVADRLSTVDEDRGLGLAFEHEDSDITPTQGTRPFYPDFQADDTTAGAHEDRASPMVQEVPDREWNTELMRNVTIRRKRTPKSSPRKERDPVVTVVESASPTPSTRARRSSGLRERVEASSNSPHTPSIESFAQSIGWPTEDKETPGEKQRDVSNKRLSTSSAGSAMVEAKIIVTPPRRRQTLRHSGKNMAYRRDCSSPADLPSVTYSNRNSVQSDDVPLHRLVHKRVSVADRKKRISAGSETLASERAFSSPVSSLRQRTIDSSAHTLRHQESIRMVLQPAADILSKSNSLQRPYLSNGSFHKRIASAPEPVKPLAPSSGPRNYAQLPPPESPRQRESVPFQSPARVRDSPAARSPKPIRTSPASKKEGQQRQMHLDVKHPANINKSLPDLPTRDTDEHALQDIFVDASEPVEDPEEKRPPSALMERVRQLVADREAEEESALTAEPGETAVSPEPLKDMLPLHDSPPSVRRGSRSSRGRSGERRGSSHSQDRASLSPDTFIRPSLDRVSTEEMVRRSHEWRRPSEEHGRVSFDRSTIRTEEHAMARHLFAQTTPFSQLSDTPIEVSEATAVSIFPHNNHSLLVVQQVSRGNSMLPDQNQLAGGTYLSPQDHRNLQRSPTPPFVDASEEHIDSSEPSTQPMLTFEPSTPPMQIALPQPGAVDSPLKNPRPPPEPPKINFIPPTPAEELERQLVPGPPKRSDSHPQRRLTLVQRARRYSDNIIRPVLARAASTRSRHASDSHTHRNPRMPTVNDEDGTLHPFWRPRGFWDDFEDSESESDEEETLPTGGDTSDVPEPTIAPPKRTNTLGKRLTSGFKGSGGFLIGNSLGVERHGTNKRRHHVTLPRHFPRSPKTSTHASSPKILIQPPTVPLGRVPGGGISKKSSRNSLGSNAPYELASRRASWRQGRNLPGLKKYQVQYIGLSGMKERLRERTAEKRREKLRQSIGTRYYVEPGVPAAA
ncbi:Nn.00g010130.m01.CDS01 [Neocucurbitaria sp. VM-36]